MDGCLKAKYVPVIACFILTVYTIAGHSAIDHKQKCNFFNKNGTNLYRLSLENCTKECAIRSNCLAVDYFRREHKCALIQNAEDRNFTAEFRNCMHVRKEEMEYHSVCNCSEYDICDQFRKTCEVQECSAISEIQHATVLGNMNRIGSRLKIHCLPGHVEISKRETTQCLPNGNWSYPPKCVKLTLRKACIHKRHCGELGYVCINKICSCDFFHRYDATLMKCVKVCSNMTNEFTKYQNTLIWGYNLRANLNRTSCYIDCVKDDMCLSYEVRRKRCNLGILSYQMAIDAFPGDIYHSENESMFSRNCV